MKSIQTRYAGCHFRSRTEARWAVFFDHLGIEWRYELEGWEFGGVRYLPDFWLPEQQCWMEVKGTEPTEAEWQKAYFLAEGTGRPVFIFYGEVGPDGTAQRFANGWDDEQMWCECPHCGSFGIEYHGRAARLPCRCIKKNDGPSWADRGHNAKSTRLLAAYEAARSARFEFGDAA